MKDDHGAGVTCGRSVYFTSEQESKSQFLVLPVAGVGPGFAAEVCPGLNKKFARASLKIIKLTFAVFMRNGTE